MTNRCLLKSCVISRGKSRKRRRSAPAFCGTQTREKPPVRNVGSCSRDRYPESVEEANLSRWLGGCQFRRESSVAGVRLPGDGPDNRPDEGWWTIPWDLSRDQQGTPGLHSPRRRPQDEPWAGSSQQQGQQTTTQPPKVRHLENEKPFYSTGTRQSSSVLVVSPSVSNARATPPVKASTSKEPRWARRIGSRV